MSINYDKYINSAGTHYIANSGKDERGAYQGGRAGDQSGHEWELKKWYSRPWTVVLRYPVQIVALEIAKLSVAAALNDRIGYDQAQRATYWRELQKAGYDPSKITVACEEDCTAGVSANVRAAGYLCGVKALQDVPICTSRNMRQAFTAAGFQTLTTPEYLASPDCLLPGDILLCENHHAAANVTIGKAARNRWRPGVTVSAFNGACVDVTGDVYVRRGPSAEYGVMGVAHMGERLRGFGFQHPENGWILVEYNGATGWVSGRYARIEKGGGSDVG